MKSNGSFQPLLSLLLQILFMEDQQLLDSIESFHKRVHTRIARHCSTYLRRAIRSEGRTY